MITSIIHEKLLLQQFQSTPTICWTRITSFIRNNWIQIALIKVIAFCILRYCVEIWWMNGIFNFQWMCINYTFEVFSLFLIETMVLKFWVDNIKVLGVTEMENLIIWILSSISLLFQESKKFFCALKKKMIIQ